MEVGNREAKAGRGLKAAGRGVHADRGGSKGIVGREEERAPVLAVRVGGVGRTGEDVVPFQDIVFGRVSDDEWRGISLDGGIFARELG